MSTLASAAIGTISPMDRELALHSCVFIVMIQM
jgi:hypothetical protein